MNKAMWRIITILVIRILFINIISAQIKTFNLNDYAPFADGITDDTEAFKRMLKDVEKSKGGNVTIPAGDYYLLGDISLPISSNTTITAYGATFYLPEKLDDRHKIVLFKGTDVVNLFWFGGCFKGSCFNPNLEANSWEPNVNTRMIVIDVSKYGVCDRLTFRDILSDRIAGAVVNVNGFTDKSDSPDNTDINFATNITIENCTLINSGKFMWDYGYLWQIIVFSDDYSDKELEMAKKYFPYDRFVRENVKIKGGTDKIYFNNEINPIGVTTKEDARQYLCFAGSHLPKNIIRGKQYYIVDSTPEYIRISEEFQGAPVVFSESSGNNTSIIYNLWDAFYSLYAPQGEGYGKGCIDLVRCKNTLITSCKISALGDAMHIYCCHNNVFSNNHILGARMGAFFLAEFCKNSTIIGNLVDGKNGSRIMSIEQSNQDVIVESNTFRNGGRGSWINQPNNLIMKNNIFVHNTNKGTRDNRNGRRNYRTGEWQCFPEIYFTTYQNEGKYGHIILKDNIFVTDSTAVAVLNFEKNGFDIQIEGNVFQGATNDILVDELNETIYIEKKQNAVIKTGEDKNRAFSNK
jgi:hypothetical protein